MVKEQVRRIKFQKMVKVKRAPQEELKPVPIQQLDFVWDDPRDVQSKEDFKRGKSLYEYNAKKQKRLNPKDQKWFSKLLNGGTIGDRISALSVQIKDEPLHALQPLHKLIEIASAKSREKFLRAQFTLKDIFLHVLLKQGVPLTFDQGHGDEAQRYYWHCVQKMLVKFCELITNSSTDILAHVRRQAINMMIELHAHYPIPTHCLINSIVNKFGDSDKGLVRLLTKKLSEECSIKGALSYPILREMYGFMHRPNLPEEAQYYCLNFMNSLNLQNQDTGTLSYLLRVFLILLKKLIKVPGADTNHSKLFSQILRGINKTIPFGSKFNDQLQELYTEHEKVLFKLIATSENLKIKIQTLYFVYQIQSPLNDHFYRSLYELLLNVELQNSSLAEVFFDLLFLSIKADNIVTRQKAIIKRLLQVATHSNLAFTITSLICVHKLTLDLPLLDDQEQKEQYDAFKRDPKYANASNINELQCFTQHYHPKVRQTVQSILLKKEITQKINPLVEYQLGTFLAKFAEQKNRQVSKISNMSANQIEDEFKLKYLKQRVIDRATLKQKQPQEEEDQDEDDFADELFEKELNKQNLDEDDEGTYKNRLDLEDIYSGDEQSEEAVEEDDQNDDEIEEQEDDEIEEEDYEDLQNDENAEEDYEDIDLDEEDDLKFLQDDSPPQKKHSKIQKSIKKSRK